MDASADIVFRFGVGRLLAKTFEVHARRIVPLTLLAMVPTVVLHLFVYGPLSDIAEAIGRVLARLGDDTGDLAAWAFLGGASAILYATTLVGCTLPIASTAPGRLHADLARALWGAVRAVRPLGGLSLWIGGMFGALVAAVLNVPGFFVMVPFILAAGCAAVSALCVIVPVTVAEPGIRGAVGRSLALTEGHRWPILGTLIVLTVVAGTVSIGLAVGAGFAVHFMKPSLVQSAANLPPAANLAGSFWLVLPMSIGLGPLYVGVALIYGRLREIKEGAGAGSLTDVFE